MGLISKTILRDRAKANSSSNSKLEKSAVADITPSRASKEIDWEERHFQICLALLSRTDVHSYHSNTVSTVKPNLSKIIKTADEMVELLKKHQIEGEINDKNLSSISNSENIKETTIDKNSPKSELGNKACRERVFADLWGALEDLGYAQGADIPFMQFFACCRELNIELDEDEVDKFAAIYEVNIG